MNDYRIPELPSDEELGIAGADGDDHPGSASGAGHRVASPPDGREPGGPSRAAPPPVRGRPGPAPWTTALVTLAVLLGGSWLSSSNRTLPSPVPANAPESTFASARAMFQLVEMARAPRPVGSPEHARVRGLLLERLEELGLEPAVHTTLHRRRSGQTVTAVTLRNILARIPGTDATGAVLLTAHYDAVPLSHGAGDDGAGVVTILEALRAIRTGSPLRNDLIVFLTDGEELGLLGARAFVEEHPWMDDVRVVLSVEMRGGGGPSIMFETGADNGWIIGVMKAADPHPFAHSLSVEVYRRLPNDTDFSPFRDAGIQGLNFAAIDRHWIYHQATDVAANVEEASLQHHGARVLALTRELGNRDLSQVHAPDRVYMTLPVLGLLTHRVGWVLPLSGAVLLFWVGTALLVRARGARWTGIAAGLGIGVVALAGGAGAGWALLRILPRFHPEFGLLGSAFYGEGWYMLGLTALAAALVLALLGVAARRFPLPALATGALFLPVAGAVILGIAYPLTAVVLQWPAAAGVLAVMAGVLLGGQGTVPGSGRTRFARSASLALVVVLAFAVLASFVPILELLLVGMSFRVAPVLGVMVGLTLICLIPALAELSRPNRWWAPLGALVLAAAFTGAGWLSSWPSAERPLPSTLIYALDRESGEAVWATRVDAGYEWAQERAGPFEVDGTLERFLWPAARFRFAAAPAVDAPPPEVRIASLTETEHGIRLRLAVRSEIGAEILRVRIPDDAAGAFVSVEGRPVPAAAAGTPGAGRAVTRVNYQGMPEDDTLVLELDLPGEEEVLRLELFEEHLRAHEIVGGEAFRRPPHLMPSVWTRSDRALFRTPVELRLEAEAETPPVAEEESAGAPAG